MNGVFKNKFVRVIFIPACVIYLLRLDNIAGEFVDDGWYLLLAKSLATGHGYTLINSPSPGIVPIYPPAYPFLLSLLWRISPQFPANIWLLKCVSLTVMLLMGITAYWYFSVRRALPPMIAGAITLATLLIPAFVFTATSTLMSECVFALAQLLTVIFVERSLQEIKTRNLYLFLCLGAGCASFAFLTRAMAIALIGAVALYIFWKSSFRVALSFGAIVVVLVSPWMIYSHIHAPTPEQQNEQKSYVVYDYKDHFWRQQAGVSGARKIGAGDLPARMWENLKNIFCRDTGGIFFPSLFRPSEESGTELIGMGYCGGEASDLGLARQTMIISSVISLLMLIGFALTVRKGGTLAEIVVLCSLLLTLLWPWWSFRFVLPLAPFLLFYLIAGLQGIGRSLPHLHQAFQQTDSWKLARLTLGVMIALQIYDHTGFLLGRFDIRGVQPPKWTENYKDIQATIAFLRQHAEADAVIATDNPALVHLLTGYKTISCDDAEKSQQLWKKLNIRYLVKLSPFSHDSNLDKCKPKLLYESPRLKLKIIGIGISSALGQSAVNLIEEKRNLP